MFQTTNNNNKKGLKRVIATKNNQQELKNISSPDYDKDEDFDYYCILKEGGQWQYKIYQIPSQLCYYREHLIETKNENGENLFKIALKTLSNKQNFKFKVDVKLNNGMINNNDKNQSNVEKETVIPFDKVPIKEVYILKQTHFIPGEDYYKYHNTIIHNNTMPAFNKENKQEDMFINNH